MPVILTYWFMQVHLYWDTLRHFALPLASSSAYVQRLDRQSHWVTDRTVCWLRVPLVHRMGTLSGSVATAEQHTHSCSTTALSRENMDLLRHLPCQADTEDESELCRLILKGNRSEIIMCRCERARARQVASYLAVV